MSWGLGFGVSGLKDSFRALGFYGLRFWGIWSLARWFQECGFILPHILMGNQMDKKIYMEARVIRAIF